ncbi:S8 family serine peptidase [Undibacterium sp. Jales W-56]|uniref:S8 family peptidase n=1 Tax=Undibacterium sp. Jales W-56 TaxID=2897325 RepID=UPI0021D2D8E0|nr:S8 family serine peptidase [Undibacterium sp. Jales W-56]MCU6434026.1 S8 family serine peptidase [Undibacterium sp. Jales W-56]
MTRLSRRRLAEELAQLHGLKLVDDWPMPALNIDCYVMEESANEPLDKIIESLSRDPRVEWAQAVHQFDVQANNDPLYPVQPAAKSWQLSDVHKVATGRNVVVAVIDSGIESKHPDLIGQITIQENFVSANPYIAENHGTGIAGVIAARAGNGGGIMGVAPDAHLMALRACWQENDLSTKCNSFTLGKALHFAIMRDPQVINLSLSGPDDQLLLRLLELAHKRGIKLVGAVDPGKSDGGFPASHPAVFAVSNQDTGKLGDRVLIAPGRDIPTTLPGSRWNFVSGSSYSAAHISGMMALLSELKPSVSALEIRQNIIMKSSGHTEKQSDRNIDLCATITKISGKCACTCEQAHAVANRH